MMVKIAVLAGIQVDPTVNRFVADTHSLIVRVVDTNAGRDGFRWPLCPEFVLDIFNEWLMILAAIATRFMSTLFRNGLCGVIPVNCIVIICKPITPDLS
jgi:hypothetical protein